MRTNGIKLHSIHIRSIYAINPLDMWMHFVLAKLQLEYWWMASLEPAEQLEAGGYHLFEISVDTDIMILKLGRKFSYRIPNFSVLHVDMRQISYQVLSADGAMLLFDSFIHTDSKLDVEKQTHFTIQLKDFCCLTKINLHVQSVLWAKDRYRPPPTNTQPL